MTFSFGTLILSEPFWGLFAFIVSILLYVYIYYLVQKRKQGVGYTFDDEGVIIDLKGNKVYWYEIKEINYMNFQGFKSTVIYPHYTYHEIIRSRRGKKLPTPAHSIDWIEIERPREFHEKLPSLGKSGRRTIRKNKKPRFN